jgi:hypothetical protein
MIRTYTEECSVFEKFRSDLVPRRQDRNGVNLQKVLRNLIVMELSELMTYLGVGVLSSETVKELSLAQDMVNYRRS